MTDSALDLKKMPVEKIAILLDKSGARSASETAIREDIAAGAPVNADGTMNLMHYVAWLAQRNQT